MKTCGLTRFCILVLSAFLSVFLSAAAFADTHASTTWVVEFKAPPSAKTLWGLTQRGLRVERLSPYRSAYFDRVYRVQGPETAQATLEAHPAVAEVEASTDMHFFSQEDPLFAEQWALKNTGAAVREEITDLKSNFRKGIPGVDLGWTTAQPGLDAKMHREAVVAVLDSGVDIEHEDLAAHILRNEKECDNGRIPLGVAKDDRDGNGYPGDCMGVDLTTPKPAQKNRPYDEWGHGTHVASLMAAVRDNGLGIKGLSNRIRILPVKVMVEDDRNVRVALSDRVAEGILYAVSRGADVINLSVGWPRGLNAKHVEEAVKEAARKGVLVVAAAGNNSHSIPVYPCAYKDVICVGASRNDGHPAGFTNYGAHVDILAPGDFILGAYPEKLIPRFFHVNGYELKSGTSQAAPYVAGALAILKGLYPTASREWITGKLLGNVRPVVKTSTDSTYFNGGVLTLRGLADGQAPHLVRWLYKQTAVAAVGANGTFQVPITLQNLSAQGRSVTVRLTADTKGVRFTTAARTFTLSPWQTRTLNFVGKVAGSSGNSQVESQLRFHVDMAGEKRIGEILLARDLGEVAGVAAFPVQNSRDVNRLMTVVALDNEVKGLFYFTLAKATDDDGLSIQLWKRAEHSIRYVGAARLQGIAVPVGFFEMDANGDGRRDIVVLALRKVDVDGKQEYRLSIFYFNEDLTPLIPNQARVDLNGENLFNFSSFNNHRKTRWVPQELPGFGLLKIPSIIESGLAPKEDMMVHDRRAGRNSQTNHVYYLQPIRNDKGQAEFKTRILDGRTFQEEVRKAMDLRYYEVVTPQWTPLTTNESDHAEYIFRAGVLEKSTVLKVTFAADGVHWKKLNWMSPYVNYVPMSAADNGSVTGSRDILFGLVAPNRAHLVVLDPSGETVQRSLILDLPDEWEDIVRPLYVAIDGARTIAVLESGLSLYGFIFQGDRLSKVHQRRVVRSTFHGNAVSQVFLPVLLPNGESALYVDSTQLYANNVFLWKLDPVQGFTAPLKSDYTLPDACRSLNPVQWDLRSAHSMSFLCEVKDGFEIRYLKVN